MPRLDMEKVQQPPSKNDGIPMPNINEECNIETTINMSADASNEDENISDEEELDMIDPLLPNAMNIQPNMQMNSSKLYLQYSKMTPKINPTVNRLARKEERIMKTEISSMWDPGISSWRGDQGFYKQGLQTNSAAQSKMMNTLISTHRLNTFLPSSKHSCTNSNCGSPTHSNLRIAFNTTHKQFK